MRKLRRRMLKDLEPELNFNPNPSIESENESDNQNLELQIEGHDDVPRIQAIISHLDKQIVAILECESQ